MTVAIFGGAFNPPHNEHINMALEALKAGADRVAFVPSNLPPHKNCDAAFDTRVDMLELAIGDRPNLEICPIEGADNRVHCSYETLPRLKKIYGDVVFVIGGDSLIDLHTWRRPDEVVAVCPIWVFDRGARKAEFDAALQYWRKRGAQIRVMDYRPKDISSTMIRYRAEYGDLRDLDPRVAEYIVAHDLYRRFGATLQRLAGELSPERYGHTLRVAECALRLNAICRLGLDNDKAFTAAILHDCAKSAVARDYRAQDVPTDSLATPIAHQFAGAAVARDEYGVTDEEILDAVRYHATGRAKMSALEKLIYVADLSESGRSFDGVAELRSAIRADFESGFRACVRHVHDYLSSLGAPIYPLGEETYRFYCREGEATK